ncbi:MAG: hypothetical protein AAFO06_06750 [Cyanobacteria bacterium J06597_16]
MQTATTNCEPVISKLLTGASPQSLHPIAQGRFCFYQLFAVSVLFYSSAYKLEREVNGGYTVHRTKGVHQASSLR